MSKTLHLTHEALRAATDDRSWERGMGYFHGGNVDDLFVDDGTVFATVIGQSAYRVELRAKRARVIGDCTCPMGADGVFCKHCVATGLAYLDAEGVAPTKRGSGARRGAKRGAPTLDDIRTHLTKQPTERLVELLMRQVRNDDRLRERLRMDIAAGTGEAPDTKAFRKAVESAMRPRGFIDYYAAVGYARAVDETVDAIAALLDEGHAEAVIELAEHALECWEEAIQDVDDSDGHMTPIQERLVQLHHAACRRAKPSPVTLARRLFEWELASEWETFYGAAETYADVLGEQGLAEYRRLADGAWAKLSEVGPDAGRFHFDSRRFRVQSMMESLTRDNVDELIEVKSKDLSSPFTFLEIARILADAGRDDEALEWAERGHQSFKEHPDERLVAFLFDQYCRAGRNEDAVSLRWEQFKRIPSIHAYVDLHEVAEPLGEWEQWREKAHRLLRRAAGSSKRQRRDEEEDHIGGVLIQVLLWEDRIDEAWNEACRGECSVTLWRKVADARASNHPGEAAGVLALLVEPIVQQTNQQAYADAIELIVQMKEWMVRAKQKVEFDDWLAQLRDRHARKRNFIKLIERV